MPPAEPRRQAPDTAQQAGGLMCLTSPPAVTIREVQLVTGAPP